jgi:aspartate racemase
VRERLGGLHSAKVVLHSVDFAEIERMQVEGRWDDAGKALAEAAAQVQAGGADFLLICTNTMHKVFDQVQAAVDIPVIHLGDTTAQAIKRAGFTTVGLLGTGFTMDQPFYRERLESHGLKVLLPSAEDRAMVHRVIYEELCLGIVREQSRRAYQDVISRFEGAQGVILGCTEIELLITQADVQLPVFPTTRLHVEAAVERAIQSIL